MHSALAVENSTRRLTLPFAPEQRGTGIALTRDCVTGPLSLLGRVPVSIDAEAGLAIQVHSGCLWLPHHEDHHSVGVASDEVFVVQRAGTITALAERGTQVTLQWPSDPLPGRRARH